MVKLLVLLLLIAGCAHQLRTQYRPFKKEEGYREKVLANNLHLVNFKANSSTKKKVATQLAQFRAIEMCQTEGFKLAHLLDSSDKTSSKTITRSSTTGYPSYYYGMSPFYRRQMGFGYGMGMGYSSFNTNTWNETLHYPEVEIVFECTNDVLIPKVDFREVPAEELKHLVKDLRGALQVENIPQDSPNGKVLKDGDIVLRGNGQRVQETYQLLSLFRKSSKNIIQLEVLRDGVLVKNLKLKGVPDTEAMLLAQAEMIKAGCKYEELKKHPLCVPKP